MCKELEIDVHIDSDVSQEHIETAIRFVVEPFNEKDAKKYIVAFFQKLLLQREKLDRGLLFDELKPSVVKMWQEVVSSLEEKNRKLVQVDHGSVVFTLFCPTTDSCRQLQDENWRGTLITKTEELLKSLGLHYFIYLLLFMQTAMYCIGPDLPNGPFWLLFMNQHELQLRQCLMEL